MLGDSTYQSSFKEIFDTADIEYCFLKTSEIDTIDTAIRNSVAIEDRSLDFSDQTESRSFDASTAEECVDFLRQESDVLPQQEIVVCDDYNDNYFTIKFSDFLSTFPEIDSLRQGHFLIVDKSFDPIAIVKLPLWISVRTRRVR